jgi:hypothetical protein
VEGGGLIILLKSMCKLIANLFLVLLLVSVQTADPTCPYGYYDETGCKDCSSATTCGEGFCSMYYSDLSTGTAVCTLIPPCAVGEFFNGAGGTQEEKICTACDSGVSTMEICNSNKCPGFSWVTVGDTSSCVLSAECEVDKFVDADGMCSPCSDAATEVCGVKNGCLNYFFTAGDASTCSPCNDPNVDTAYQPLANTVCNCIPGFFWNAGACAECSTATDAAACSLCKGFYAVGEDADFLCNSCTSDSNSNGEGDYSGSTAGCGCNAGYVWDSANSKCDTCATVGTTATLCHSASCAGFAFDGTDKC